MRWVESGALEVYILCVGKTMSNRYHRTLDQEGHQGYPQVLDQIEDSTMDCGVKTLIFLSFCVVVQSHLWLLKNDLKVLISVPSTHMGDTEIGPAVLTIKAGHPLMYTVTAQKNETKCINSAKSLCTSLMKEPRVDISVSSRASNGKTSSYSASISASQRLVIFVGSEVSVRPQPEIGERGKISVILDVMYDEAKTSRGSLSSRRRPETFTLDVEFFTTTKWF
ncbi:uncharacterized protein [Engystomops pustulosus]|uniref:uncharacterized protein n=1 Tax=Engystomops pustulosus TaxID=76066 RepID=UPI003AFB5BF8